MSYADHIFINMCKDIIENGTSTEGEKVRPKWEDGTSAYTIKQFGVVNRYDLSKEFPALTLRRTAIKSCTDEMLWIWQQKSNNINDLHSHVWDEWADETGSIGKAYGYQMGVKHQYKEGMMAVSYTHLDVYKRQSGYRDFPGFRKHHHRTGTDFPGSIQSDLYHRTLLCHRTCKSHKTGHHAARWTAESLQHQYVRLSLIHI